MTDNPTSHWAKLCVAELRERNGNRFNIRSTACQAVGLHSMKSKLVPSIVSGYQQSTLLKIVSLKSKWTTSLHVSTYVPCWCAARVIHLLQALAKSFVFVKSNNNINDVPASSVSAFILSSTISLTSDNGKAQLRAS